MIIRARAPLRISFGGGGTDVSPYCDDRGGAVLSTTINRFAFATVRPADRIIVHSADYDVTLSYDVEDDFTTSGQLDLAMAVVDYFRKIGALKSGVEVSLHNDAPPGSGLGSSSAIAIALVKAFSTYLNIPMDSYALADLAFRIERVELKQHGGRQDQYAAAFGGVNFMEFHNTHTVVHPLRLPSDIMGELEYRLVCAYIGRPRLSSKIIEQQANNYREGNTDAVAAMDEVKALSFKMRDAMLSRQMDTFGTLLNAAWHAKRRMAAGISNEHIDAVYDAAMKAGAVGGKISGAGGGGFIYFLSGPTNRVSVQSALKEAGCQLTDFQISLDGAMAWRVG